MIVCPWISVQKGLLRRRGEPVKNNIRKQYFISFFGSGYKRFLKISGGFSHTGSIAWVEAKRLSGHKNAGTVSSSGADSILFWHVMTVFGFSRLFEVFFYSYGAT